MTKITIIGVGELGQALGRILSHDGREILYWDRNDAQLEKLRLPLLSLPEVITNAEFVFLCIPSWGVREALAFLKPYWSAHTVAVFFSKGIDGPTSKLPIEMASKLLPKNISFAVASGTMVAEEISEGHFGACLVASKNNLISEKVSNLFADTNLMAVTSADIKGVAWSGVLKNIYALGMGIAEGLGWTVNERGILFGQSNEEIMKLLKLLGGKKETWLSAPILGDFVTTSFDNHSLNHQVGLELGRTGQTEKRSEGTMSLAPLIDRLKKKGPKDFPILFNLAQIVIAREDPKKVFGKY